MTFYEDNDKHNTLDVSWRVNAYCNYDCDYCFSRTKDKKKLWRGDPGIQKLVDAFDRTGRKCFILITGGEPFFHPDFVEMCRGLTRNHTIGVNTNLSHRKVYDFADSIDPEKVKWMDCSIHIKELERLKMVDEFIQKFQYLKDRGFPVYANYVLYPEFMKRFDEDHQFFKSKGIILWPKLFKGPYTPIKIPFRKGILRKANRALEILFAKHYPDALGQAQRDRLLFYINRSLKDTEDRNAEAKSGTSDYVPRIQQDIKVLNGVPSFKGRLCNAGKDFIFVNETGKITRCHSVWKSLGNLYSGEYSLHNDATPCEANTCICPYEGFEYLVNNHPETAGISNNRGPKQ